MIKEAAASAAVAKLLTVVKIFAVQTRAFKCQQTIICCNTLATVIASDSRLVQLMSLPLNRHRTYKAELSEGSDQEKAAYVLNRKQKVVKLVSQWVALYGLLLKEDPIALDFLEVTPQARFNHIHLLFTVLWKSECFHRILRIQIL